MNSAPRFLFVSAVLLASAGWAPAVSKVPPRPLKDRVAEAEHVFAGTLADRVEKGDWVTASLRVDTPLRGAAEKEKVEVTWRKRLGELEIYDAAEGDRGIAILKEKHGDRYWLRADKFEPVGKLDEVKEFVAAKPEAPTFEEWMKAGKPIPEGMMFTGGTPWFDESTGKNRTPEEVYKMLYPKGGGEKPKPAGRFPAHWGDPPQLQTRDLRPLPGGYGMGSSTLAKWIQTNLEKDAGKAGGAGVEAPEGERR
jgi:hypothetical protein